MVAHTEGRACCSTINGPYISEGKQPGRNYLVSAKPLYENCKLFAPDGSLLCTCSKSKIKWYLKKNLAVDVPQPEGEPPAAKLLFVPAGKPADATDFYCQEKVNQCCCCARTEKLVRKNIIPKEYRRHFPKEYKDRQSHDVVLLCVQCHCSSNVFDNIMRENIASEHGIPVNYKNQFTVTIKPLVNVRAAARALAATNNVIPEERRLTLTQTIADHLGHEPTPDDIQELRNIETSEVKDPDSVTDHGTLVIKKVMVSGKEIEFIKKWRNFFLTMMKPAHLPTGWNIDHKTRDVYQAMETNEEESSEMIGPQPQASSSGTAEPEPISGTAEPEPILLNQEKQPTLLA